MAHTHKRKRAEPPRAIDSDEFQLFLALFFGQNGAFTIPVIPPGNLARYRAEIDRDCQNFPEYKNHTVPKILGGFAAYGNPSSFHCRSVRRLRAKVYRALRREVAKRLAIVRDALGPHVILPDKMAINLDRLLIREAGLSPGGESTHRDVPVRLGSHDLYCLGWLNLDNSDQVLQYAPGSHLGVQLESLVDGFALLTPEEKEQYTSQMVNLTIPPGHYVVAPSWIVHMVANKAKKHTMYRLFTGLRLTTKTKSMYPHLDQMLDRQEVPVLCSGQKPPMYSPNHYQYTDKNFNITPTYRNSLVGWSQAAFRRRILRDGKNGRIPRYLKSLAEYRLPLYPAYSPEERALYIPQPVFRA